MQDPQKDESELCGPVVANVLARRVSRLFNVYQQRMMIDGRQAVH